jgi:hypothetical protein
VITVPDDIPCNDLLNRIIAGLDSIQKVIDTIDEELSTLRDAGVFLSREGKPVVPTWWERKDEGRTVGWYLNWPTWYAQQEAGKQRWREYIRKEHLEETRAKVERSKQYVTLENERARLQGKLASARSDLKGTVDWFRW